MRKKGAFSDKLLSAPVLIDLCKKSASHMEREKKEKNQANGMNNNRVFFAHKNMSMK